jgi:4-diphosphocytidyl-2-C-methyl-D-erythritol kinase
VRLSAFAPAKVNLFLHVGAPRADGLHPIAGLSAFADVGDHVVLEAEGPPGLRVTGPMAEGVPTGSDNLVLRALAAFGDRFGVDVSGVGLELHKALPPASGIGGGTSDAGATLRLARAAFAPDVTDAELLDLAAGLGADGPMCLFPRVVWTEGTGEVLTPEPDLTPLPAVLVNPRVPTPTGAVFRAYDAGTAFGADLPPPPKDWSTAGVLNWLSGGRNDLQAPATGLVPVIAEVCETLLATDGVRLVRMSGSGATVFGLYETQDAARAAAASVARARPDWWTVAVTLGDQDGAISAA